MTAPARLIAALFRMDEGTWARHANPWSVWTRMATLPVLLAAIWSHTALGWWALVPGAIVVAWLWLNPRLFPPPASTRSWASRAVLGERLWLDRDRPIDREHRTAATFTSTVASLGFAAAVYGAVVNDWGWTVAGAAVCYLGKLWFIDRMVWVFEDERRRDPAVAAWLR
jgi:hypothetical protein